VGVREFRARVREVLDRVTAPGGAAVAVGSRRPEAVVMSVSEYEALMARSMANDRVRAVVANQRLEGLEPTPAEVTVLLDVAEGRVSVDAALDAAVRRARARAQSLASAGRSGNPVGLEEPVPAAVGG